MAPVRKMSDFSAAAREEYLEAARTILREIAIKREPGVGVAKDAALSVGMTALAWVRGGEILADDVLRRIALLVDASGLIGWHLMTRLSEETGADPLDVLAYIEKELDRVFKDG